MESGQIITLMEIGFELVGVGTIVIGAIVSLVACVVAVVHGKAWLQALLALRRGVGRAILLGLEFLVAADIIRSVAVEPTIESVAVLGLIVLVRTFLSWSMDVEITGEWPWRRAESRASSDSDDVRDVSAL